MNGRDVQFAIVTRSINVHSDEARCAGAHKSIASELNTFVERDVLRWADGKPWAKVIEEKPMALRVKLHLLLGIKHVDNPALQTWHARLVALEHVIYDTGGVAVVEEDTMGILPILMRAAASLMWSPVHIPKEYVKLPMQNRHTRTQNSRCAYTHTESKFAEAAFVDVLGLVPIAVDGCKYILMFEETAEWIRLMDTCSVSSTNA